MTEITIGGKLHLAALAFALSFTLPTVGNAESGAAVRRNVHLRAEPSTSSESLRILMPPTSLQVLDEAPRNNFLRVRTDEGEEGWVWAQNIRVTTHAGSSAFAARKAKAEKKSSGPCADDLDSCPLWGCAQKGTPHALLNSIKRAMPTTTDVVELSFEDFATLQAVADDLGLEQGHGSNLTTRMRKQLHSIELGNGRTVGEGSYVQLVGYIAPERDIKASGGESVNCRLTGTANNDIHLPIVKSAEDSEYHAVVVEPIPQQRPDAWSIAQFKAWQRAGTLLMVRGQLFFDNQHKVRDDPEHEDGLKSQPKRFTLWEIHPVKQFYECKLAGQHCDPSSMEHWERVD